MTPTIHLPKPDELAYNLNKLPQGEDEYKKAMTSLAVSVIDYSKQIASLNLVEAIIHPELDIEEKKNGHKL